MMSTADDGGSQAEARGGTQRRWRQRAEAAMAEAAGGSSIGGSISLTILTQETKRDAILCNY